MAKFCKKCGNNLLPGSKFCNVCGEKVPLVKAMQFCTSCGGRIQVGTKFCNHCGTPIGEKEVTGPPNIPKKYCVTCGKIIVEGKRFCTGCGTPVEGALETIQVPNQEPVTLVSSTPNGLEPIREEAPQSDFIEMDMNQLFQDFEEVTEAIEVASVAEEVVEAKPLSQGKVPSHIPLPQRKTFEYQRGEVPSPPHASRLEKEVSQKHMKLNNQDISKE